MADTAAPGRLGRILNGIEVLGNRLPHPTAVLILAPGALDKIRQIGYNMLTHRWRALAIDGTARLES